MAGGGFDVSLQVNQVQTDPHDYPAGGYEDCKVTLVC